LEHRSLVSVVIPTLNEGETIGRVLDELDSMQAEWGRPLDVVVVDDGSRDGTADEVTRRGVRFLRNPGPKGKGASLSYGFAQTEGDLIVMMDGDGSHRAGDIPVLVAELERDSRIGLVIGSRIIGGSDEYSRIRALGNIVLTGMFGLLFRRYLSDALNGFKAMRRVVVELEKPRAKSFGIETELIASALRAGYRVVETPSHERARQGGRPKSKVIRHGLVLALSILREYWRDARQPRTAPREASGARPEAAADSAEGPWEVVVTDPLDEQGLELLRSDPRIRLIYRPDVTAEELPALVSGARALVVRGRTKVTADVLSAAAGLVAVGRAGSGLDNIDTPAASEAGIEVVNAAEGNAASTAELVMLHVLSLARDYWRAVGSVKSGGWGREAYLGHELQGKILGVVGLGSVGREVARKASGMGMSVLGYDPEVAAATGCRVVGFDELLAKADFVTIHVPLTPSTRHMLGAPELAKMKRGSRLVHCARGGVVDEEALLSALERGHLAGAALDVYEVEPPEGNLLVGRDDVLATPHIGAATEEARRKASVQVARRVLRILTCRLS
jgi:phosphoglycerate dehydrogenase-like enzyme